MQNEEDYKDKIKKLEGEILRLKNKNCDLEENNRILMYYQEQYGDDFRYAVHRVVDGINYGYEALREARGAIVNAIEGYLEYYPERMPYLNEIISQMKDDIAEEGGET